MRLLVGINQMMAYRVDDTQTCLQESCPVSKKNLLLLSFYCQDYIPANPKLPRFGDIQEELEHVIGGCQFISKTFSPWLLVKSKSLDQYNLCLSKDLNPKDDKENMFATLTWL